MKRKRGFDNKKGRSLLVLLAIAAAAFFIANVALPRAFSVVSVNPSYVKAENGQKAALATAKADEAATAIPPAAHFATPKEVKAIYMTACVASMPKMRERLVDLVRTTELNSIVIDVKDYTGTISFPTKAPLLSEVDGPGCVVKGMKDFVDSLHAEGIYVIGRITVFQDPHYAKRHPELAVQTSKGAVWKDRKGLSFIDVGASPYWDYIVALSKESYALGFDELNFDYIRFPSDGDLDDARFTWSVERGKTKPEALTEFFAHLDKELAGTGAVTSADLFGMVTTSSGDMGIGQVLENALPYFDYIAPMVYPSHYPAHFNGWKDPNNAPYEVIEYSMGGAVERGARLRDKIASTTPDAPYLPRLRRAQFRPWLQDNDYPVPYTADMVRAQIEATYEVGLNSWMLWDASNTYTKSALLPD